MPGVLGDYPNLQPCLRTKQCRLARPTRPHLHRIKQVNALEPFQAGEQKPDAPTLSSLQER